MAIVTSVVLTVMATTTGCGPSNDQLDHQLVVKARWTNWGEGVRREANESQTNCNDASEGMSVTVYDGDGTIIGHAKAGASWSGDGYWNGDCRISVNVSLPDENVYIIAITWPDSRNERTMSRDELDGMGWEISRVLG